jgi:hypothetical protein
MRGVVLIVFALAACGGSGGTGTCQDWGSTLCDRACACGSNGKCAYGTGNFTVSLNSRSDCDTLVNVSCAQPNANSAANMMYFATCANALRASSCMPPANGHDGYVIWPDVCVRSDAGAP